MQTHRFLTHPKPDGQVVARIQEAAKAASKGQVPTIAIIVITPTNEPEIIFAGDLGPIRGNALLGAIGKAFHKLVAQL